MEDVDGIDRCGGDVVCTEYKNGLACSGFDGYYLGGDDGGPLVADKDGDRRWVLYGVLSFTNGTCQSSAFNGFSVVAYWTNFIIDIVQANP